jgi:large conductance mechanosensitive channel
MIKGFRDFLLRGTSPTWRGGRGDGRGVRGGDRVREGLHRRDHRCARRHPDFDTVGWKVNGSNIIIGSTINALIYFFIVAAAVYFFVVIPVNRLEALRRRGQEPEPEATPEDVLLLREIRDLLSTRRGGSEV